MKFAAIDIGTNALRLLLARSIPHPEEPVMRRDSLIRYPLRLGDDVFTKRKVTDEKMKQLIEALKAFRHLINAYQPLGLRACATSAMREAKNGEEVVRRIKEEANIDLEIISGKQEAEIIFSNHAEEELPIRGPVMYIDVGGGSTELTLFEKKKTTVHQSFAIGTVRLLTNKVEADEWVRMRKWIEANHPAGKTVGIGSGGNINKLFSLARRKMNSPLSLKKIAYLHAELRAATLEERIFKFGLKPDRAEVILPAADIFISIMTWAQLKKIYVPRVGLVDGLVRSLSEEHLTA